MFSHEFIPELLKRCTVFWSARAAFSPCLLSSHIITTVTELRAHSWEKCGVRGLALSLNVKQQSSHAIDIGPLWNGTSVPICLLANASCELLPHSSEMEGGIIDCCLMVIAVFNLLNQ